MTNDDKIKKCPKCGYPLFLDFVLGEQVGHCEVCKKIFKEF